MEAKTGTLSIHSENIFPIIKRFLYSDQEVFLRELVSNAVDAVRKLDHLRNRGESQAPATEARVDVVLDADAKTIRISDTGLGMTAEEVELYINQIAFSGAKAFMNTYENGTRLIGQFGLGFYSAFMVAKRVEIFTKSHQADAPAVHWSCDGDTQFALEPCDRAEVGTSVVLHLAEDAEEYLKPDRIREVLRKYCRFLPVPIWFANDQINNPQPAWTRPPSELTDDDYRNFHRELYPGAEAPLFWIHINVDYPFELKGILYFPVIRPQLDPNRHKIQLYQHQVFVTDDLENVVPEYLSLLHGVLDSPDIPLNVSRSALQTDANVRKIAQHVSKKVADRLEDLFRNERETYEKHWKSMGVFVKFGLLRDDKFAERALDWLLLTNTEGKNSSLAEYKERIREKQTDKNNKLVMLYTTQPQEQDASIADAQRLGLDVLVMDGPLDPHLLSELERRDDGLVFKRIDAEPANRLVDRGIEAADDLNEEERKAVEAAYGQVVGNPLVAVQFHNLGPDDLPAVIVRPEHTRRMAEMASLSFLGESRMPELFNLVVNTGHALTRRLLLLPDGPERTQLANQAYDLARLRQGMLEGRELTEFVQRMARQLA